MGITVYYSNEDDLKDKLAKSIKILHSLRRSTKIWQKVFGYPSKKEKEDWEDRADDFLNELKKESISIESQKIL